jgi:6-pyruvoyltetrahydropterin/6-carboxytetrahydropterin synthase
MVYLTRRYRFPSAHRLHNDAFTAEENDRIYGNCNNRYDHGHNYVLDVTVAGPVEPSTGMVADISVLDALVQNNILDKFDHTHLNLEVDTFHTIVPTTENLCIEIYKLLSEKLVPVRGGARLKTGRLEETNSHCFEYEVPM